MEKIFDDYRGVILFILVVGILAFAFTMRISSINEIANSKANDNNVKTFYA